MDSKSTFLLGGIIGLATVAFGYKLLNEKKKV